MKLRTGAAIELYQFFDRPASIYRAGLLADLKRARFAPAECANILEAHVREVPESIRFLDPESVRGGGIAATEELLYPGGDKWLFGFVDKRHSDVSSSNLRFLRLPETKVEWAARVTRAAIDHADSPEFLAALPEAVARNFRAIFQGGAARRAWPEPLGPGVYRREHASLVVQSHTTRVIFDPTSLSSAVPLATTAIPDRDLDAILITHSHADHWHIPSALAHTRTTETPVVVPHVPRATLLCPALSDQLTTLNQAYLAPPWSTTLQIGDIEIDVLPFYGEQPAADAQCPDLDVRNWGNCYRVNTPEFSALVLADSGVDPAGSMIDVAAESTTARGPIDVVFACMRDFMSPFEVEGLDWYWMVLPFSDLERLYAMYEAGRLRSTTAGLMAGGIAEICGEAQASMFAPYAHGFSGIGRPIGRGEWGPGELSEAEALSELAGQLRAAGVATGIQAWKPGDVLVPNHGTMMLQSAAAS